MQSVFTYVPFGNQWGSTNNVLKEKTLAVILQVSRDHFFLLKTDLSLEDHSFLRNNVCTFLICFHFEISYIWNKPWCKHFNKARTIF